MIKIQSTKKMKIKNNMMDYESGLKIINNVKEISGTQLINGYIYDNKTVTFEYSGEIILVGISFNN
jgi:hypothetical protein